MQISAKATALINSKLGPFARKLRLHVAIVPLTQRVFGTKRFLGDCDGSASIDNLAHLYQDCYERLANVRVSGPSDQEEWFAKFVTSD